MGAGDPSHSLFSSLPLPSPPLPSQTASRGEKLPPPGSLLLRTGGRASRGVSEAGSGLPGTQTQAHASPENLSHRPVSQPATRLFLFAILKSVTCYFFLFVILFTIFIGSFAIFPQGGVSPHLRSLLLQSLAPRQNPLMAKPQGCIPVSPPAAGLPPHTRLPVTQERRPAPLNQRDAMQPTSAKDPLPQDGATEGRD